MRDAGCPLSPGAHGAPHESRSSAHLPLVLTLLLAVNVAAAVAQVAIPAMTRPDFNGDGKDDLAVGVPGENTGAGGVHIIYGAKGGLTDLGDQFFTQNSPDIPGSEEDYDRCGTALTTGDFNGDGFADLAFGCPGEDTPASAAARGRGHRPVWVQRGAEGRREPVLEPEFPGHQRRLGNARSLRLLPGQRRHQPRRLCRPRLGLPWRGRRGQSKMPAPSTCCSDRRRASPPPATGS